MWHIIKQIPSYLYDLVISRFLTITSHILMLNHLIFRQTDKSMLDVGCGTGLPLHSIFDKLPRQMNVVGIDIDSSYVITSKDLFKDNPRVNIHEISFYDVQKLNNKKYDIVFFSFSFMLMPDKQQALKLTESILNEGGRVIFLLTLNSHKNALLEKIKPIIHKITSIDFGQVVYHDEFVKIIDESNYNIVKKQRLRNKWNPLFWFFPIHYIEISKKTLSQTPSRPANKLSNNDEL